MKTSEKEKYPTLNRILKEKNLDYLVPGNKPLTLRQANAIRNLLAPEMELDELFKQVNKKKVAKQMDTDCINEMLSKLDAKQITYVKSLIYNLYFQ